MSDVPGDLRYTSSHEWVRIEDDGTITVGISDHAQAALGELVYVEVPEVDAELSPGDSCAVVESVKAASDIYAPVEGVVTEANEALADEPQLVNEQPYDDGWIMKMQPSSLDDVNDLMDADEYEASLADEDDGPIDNEDD